MSDHTRAPYFPENLQDYAPWVATYGLLAPYGECQCGCGQTAPIATTTRNYRGQVKGHPIRCVFPHCVGKKALILPGFRRCAICGEIKPVSDFDQHKSGRDAGLYLSVCRMCARLRSRKYHTKNRDQEIARARKYRQERRAYLLGKERERSTDSEYRSKRNEGTRNWRVQNRDHIAEYDRRYAKEQAEKVKARSTVSWAVKCGELPPVWSMVCSICDEAQANQYHHHHGYDPEHWLDVVPVCLSCHGKEHRID